jgi:pimeloyl-ACP methyl ester carboxylesterase
MNNPDQDSTKLKWRMLAWLLCSLMVNSPLLAVSFDFEAPAPLNCDKASFRFWSPEGNRLLRAILVLVPGSNGDGRPLTEEPEWRGFAQKHDLALVGCQFTDRPHENMFMEQYALASAGSGQALLEALSFFSRHTRHSEVDTLSLLLWGHSAGGQFNYEFACWKPARVLAFVVNKGGVYYTHAAPLATRQVPGLFFIGEKDLEFRKMSVYGIYAVNRRARALWTLAVEPDTGHEEGKTRQLALAFFEAILPLRLPGSSSSPKGTLREISENNGWVGDLNTLKIRPGPMNENEWSSWLPSKKLANGWQAFVLKSPAHKPSF